MQPPLFEVHWTERMRRLYDWVTEHDCEENAASLVERLFEAGDGLVWSLLRYESAPEWGEGIRRLPLLGQRILFKVDEEQRRVYVLSVMGGAENPHDIR